MSHAHSHTHLYNSIYPTYPYATPSSVKSEHSPNTNSSSCGSPSPPNNHNLISPRNCHHWPPLTHGHPITHSVNDILNFNQKFVQPQTSPQLANNPSMMNSHDAQNPHSQNYNYYMYFQNTAAMHGNSHSISTGANL